MKIRANLWRWGGRHLVVGVALAILCLACSEPAQAQGATDFAGTVLTVDAAAGKLTVKKEGGGTRFTFVVNDKTQFSGPGLTKLTDVKKGDSVTVTYLVSGSQYIAQKIAKK